MKNFFRSHFEKSEKPEQKNIQAIAALEQEALHSRSLADCISDEITRFSGSMFFSILHALWFSAWIAENTGIIPGTTPFDPFPFNFLTLLVSLEAIFLSAFVLMSQNRFSRQADKRAHLDLQINLLAEQEATVMLQLLQKICLRLGITEELSSEEVHQLVRKTDVHTLVTELDKKLPN